MSFPPHPENYQENPQNNTAQNQQPSLFSGSEQNVSSSPTVHMNHTLSSPIYLRHTYVIRICPHSIQHPLNSRPAPPQSTAVEMDPPPSSAPYLRHTYVIFTSSPLNQQSSNSNPTPDPPPQAASPVLAPDNVNFEVLEFTSERLYPVVEPLAPSSCHAPPATTSNSRDPVSTIPPRAQAPPPRQPHYFSANAFQEIPSNPPPAVPLAIPSWAHEDAPTGNNSRDPLQTFVPPAQDPPPRQPHYFSANAFQEIPPNPTPVVLPTVPSRTHEDAATGNNSRDPLQTLVPPAQDPPPPQPDYFPADEFLSHNPEDALDDLSLIVPEDAAQITLSDTPPIIPDGNPSYLLDDPLREFADNSAPTSQQNYPPISPHEILSIPCPPAFVPSPNIRNPLTEYIHSQSPPGSSQANFFLTDNNFPNIGNRTEAHESHHSNDLAESRNIHPVNRRITLAGALAWQPTSINSHGVAAPQNTRNEADAVRSVPSAQREGRAPEGSALSEPGSNERNSTSDIPVSEGVLISALGEAAHEAGESHVSSRDTPEGAIPGPRRASDGSSQLREEVTGNVNSSTQDLNVQRVRRLPAPMRLRYSDFTFPPESDSFLDASMEILQQILAEEPDAEHKEGDEEGGSRQKDEGLSVRVNDPTAENITGGRDTAKESEVAGHQEELPRKEFDEITRHLQPTFQHEQPTLNDTDIIPSSVDQVRGARTNDPTSYAAAKKATERKAGDRQRGQGKKPERSTAPCIGSGGTGHSPVEKKFKVDTDRRDSG